MYRLAAIKNPQYFLVTDRLTDRKTTVSCQ